MILLTAQHLSIASQAIMPMAQMLPLQVESVVLASPAPSAKSKLDPAIERMIVAAISGGDQLDAERVIKVARQISPEAEEEIAALERRWKSQQLASYTPPNSSDPHAAAPAIAASSSDVTKRWKGQVEFGAYRSTGNSSNLGGVGSVEIEHRTSDWTNKINARVELQSTRGVTTTERVFASWQPNYRFDDQLYTFGLAQYERDRFSDYRNRYTLGGGMGYSPFLRGDVRVDLEGGPALRHTKRSETSVSTELVGRGSLNLKWQITPTLEFNQKAAVYVENAASSASANTAIISRLIGALKARFSYNLQYESHTPPRVRGLSTQSRATFVYEF